MTVWDVYVSICMISFVVGIIAMALSYADYTALTYINNDFNMTYANLGLPPNASIQGLGNSLQGFSLLFPDLAAAMVVVLIAESWILSFFIKAHPLSAVVGIFMLFILGITTFLISNEAVSIARLSLFSTIISSANPLLIIFLNIPPLFFICGIIDIAIALTASRQ